MSFISTPKLFLADDFNFHDTKKKHENEFTVKTATNLVCTLFPKWMVFQMMKLQGNVQ